MWYLYLDESGDLGFDFVNKKPSKYFTICILATSHEDAFRGLRRAVRRTLKNKLRKLHKKGMCELKGSHTSINVKRYFWKHISNLTFGIYSVTLNKRRLYDKLTREKDRIYNFIARQVIDRIPFEKAMDRVQLVVDKSKSKPEITEFNDYIIKNLQGKINPSIPLYIDHNLSHEDMLLQAVDLFCWGIFRKYERNDIEWFDVFKGKILYEDIYLK